MVETKESSPSLGRRRAHRCGTASAIGDGFHCDRGLKMRTAIVTSPIKLSPKTSGLHHDDVQHVPIEQSPFAHQGSCNGKGARSYVANIKHAEKPAAIKVIGHCNP